MTSMAIRKSITKTGPDAGASGKAVPYADVLAGQTRFYLHRGLRHNGVPVAGNLPRTGTAHRKKKSLLFAAKPVSRRIFIAVVRSGNWP